MAIPGFQQVTAPISPATIVDDQATHVEEFGRGGWRTVADNTERDAIFSERRTVGMLVYVAATGLTWQLQANLTDWAEYAPGGIDPNDVMLKTVFAPAGTVVNALAVQGSNLSDILNRANHTGTQPISATTGLQAALDAKINTSLIGVANGVAPTNSSNLIPNSFLGFSLPLDPVIAWNPITNTPTISDAGGTAGEIYIVYDSANPTVRDLGSGNISWNDGDAAIFDSGTSAFVKVAQVGVGVAQVTTELGVQTGNVVIDDTSYIAPSTDRNYVTDDVEDALLAADSPSTSNPFATMSDITDAIVVGNTFFTPNLFANNETLGDGTARTLASLGYDNTEAGNIWTLVDSEYAMDVNTMTIDWIAWQEAMLTMESQGYQSIISQSGRGYVFNQSVIPPFDQTAIALERRSKQWGFDLNYSVYQGTDSFILFDKYPVNQAQANGLQLDYSYHFKNGTGIGFDTTDEDDCFIRLGATTHSRLENMKAEKFGIAFDMQMALESMYDNIKIEKHGLYGMRLGDGMWSGSSVNIAQSNACVFRTIRFVNSKTPTANLYLNGNQNISVFNSIHEGSTGVVNSILYNNLTATTTKYNLKLYDTYFEESGATNALVKFLSNSGTIIMDGWSAQGSAANLPVLLHVESVGLPSAAPIFAKLLNSPAYTPGYKLRNVGIQKWTIDDVVLNNTGTILAAANWDLTNGGSIPTSEYVRYTQPIP